MLLTWVDAFSSSPFAGNPAAVCLLDRERDDTWMQSVAAEMNLAETAFLLEVSDGWSLRWFTPAVEVDLCGHATLASAHVLWQEGILAEGITARFHTRSGLLTAARNGAWIELDFPATPAAAEALPPHVERALGVPLKFTGRTKFDFFAVVESESDVRSLKPDLSALRELGGGRGVIVTARGNGHYDFVSRFFAPAAGIDEDPVTGSSHCALAPYWGEQLGKPEMLAFQASARGGEVRVRLSGDRVVLGGQAVTVLRGELAV